MINFLRKLFNREPAFGSSRSKDWPKVRKEHLRRHLLCALTGSKKKLEVHHILPVHLFPHLELKPSNLITLSGKKVMGVKPHQFFGHLGNFRNFNPYIIKDIREWKYKLSRDYSEIKEKVDEEQTKKEINL